MKCFDKNKEELIDFLFEELYAGDNPKYDASNLAYLNSLSRETLEDMAWSVENENR